jgi:hypothetical protein
VTTELVVLAAFAGIMAGVVLSILSIVRLVRLASQPELARAPIAPQSAVTFAQAGRVELALEGPLFTSKLRSLGFELLEPAGLPVRLDRLWMRTLSGGFSRTRLSLYGVHVSLPGTYAVRVTGIDPETDYGQCALLFVRPSGAGIALHVVSLLASIGLAAASIATAGALMLGPTATPDEPVVAPVVPQNRAAVAETRGGRAVRTDPRRLGTAQEVVWSVLRMRVRVPDDWLVRTLSETEIDLRHPTTPSTFLVGRATPMPAGPTFSDYLDAHVTHAREQLKTRLIDGYATKRIGAVPGVLTIEQRQDGSTHVITWTGFQPAAVGSLSVTLLAGAAGDDFARDEPLLGAIFDSISFE